MEVEIPLDELEFRHTCQRPHDSMEAHGNLRQVDGHCLKKAFKQKKK